MNKNNLPLFAEFCRRIGMMCALAILCVAPAMAQLTTGTITGAVTDSSGAAVPGATITVKNVDTGASRTTVSGPSGRYEVSNVPIGKYDVSATLAGFQTSVHAGVELTLGRTAVVDHSLQVGEVAQAVTVTGEVSMVETSSATVSSVVTAQQIEDAPLRGRDLTQLSLLQPGVMKMPAGYGAFSGLGDKITVAGARGNQNLYLLDGVSNSDLSGNPQGASGAYLGADTVKEFQVITNNYSAEYQSAAGAIVSAVTKSGTNALHGTGFWTSRNSQLDANSWTNNRNDADKRDFHRNQYGGSFGGPIRKDKAFFFGSYEGFRERNNDNDYPITWTDQVLQGILPPSEGGGTVTVNPAIRPYLDLWPRPNTAYKFAGGATFSVLRDLGNGTLELLAPGMDQRPINDNFVGSHFDYHFNNEKLGMLSGSYNWDNSDAINANAMSQLGRIEPADNSGLTSKKHTIGAKLTGVFSASMVNEANFGYSFSEAAQDLPNTSQDFTSLASLSSRKFLGQINPPNGAANVGWRVLGSIYGQTAYQFKDGLSISRGNHSLRMGAEMKLFRYSQISCSRGCNGVWGWADLSRFLQDIPLNLEIFQPGHDNPDRALRQMLFGSYFQDNWQIRPSLTLNLGLRHEFTTVPIDDNGLMSALINFNDPYVTTTAKAKADPRYKNDPVMPGTIDGYFTNPTLKSFSPRLGFAWAPGSKKTSIRGGAGMFYEYPLLFNIRTTLQESPPFVQTGTVDTSSSTSPYADYIRSGGAPLTMRPGVGSDSVFAPLLRSTPNIRAMEYNEKNVTIYRWSLTLQREMGHGTVISAGYTGSRGTHLWTQNAANVNRWVGWPNQPTGQKTFPLAPADRTRVDPVTRRAPCDLPLPACKEPSRGAYNPNFGIDMRIQSPSADSYFHGLAVGVQQRPTHGFQYQLAFNYSKSIDTGSGVTSTGENFAQGQRGVWYWDMNMKRGLSTFDMRKNFTSNFSYDLPGQAIGGVAGKLLGGWQVSGILTLTAGHPLSVFDTPTIQRNAIGQSAEQNRANLIPGGNNNKVNGGAFSYYDATQFIPSFCTGIPARVGSIRNALDSNLPICGPGDAEYDPGHFGNAGRNTLTSPGIAALDLSIQKSFKITENQRIQFRAEFFNFTNRVNLSDVIPNPYDNNGRPSPAFWRTNGQITDAGSPRTIQLGLKYIF